MKARFSTVETKYSSRVQTLIGAVLDILPDGSFRTRCILGGKDQFGRDLSNGLYTWRWENPNYATVAIVTPLAPYELFEETKDPKECNLLSIDYYMGTSNYDVVKTLGDKMFVVEERLPVEERIPNTNPPEFKLGRFNSILQYTGWEHLPKETPKYEGDAYSRIELSDECKYRMYKFIKVVAPELK
jgi:hypothetical protein